MSEWQPMDSAPKDGTQFLALADYREYPFVAYWGIVGRYTDSPKMWIGHRFGAMQNGLLCWMPLPDPPEPGMVK